jgi:spore maturation protein CgeB
MWFEPLLKDRNNIINIDKDYNNLFDSITYLIKNDKIAKKIAENGYKFREKYINKERICEYIFNYMKYSNSLC